MGFGGSAGAAIILVAAVAGVGLLYTTTYNGYEQVSAATMAEEQGDLERLNTEVEIVNVTHNTTTPETVSVTVRNQGSSTLSIADTDLLLNGAYQADGLTYTITGTDGTITAGSGGTDLWQPQENLTVTAETTVTEPIAVKFVTGPGIATTEVYP